MRSRGLRKDFGNLESLVTPRTGPKLGCSETSLLALAQEKTQTQHNQGSRLVGSAQILGVQHHDDIHTRETFTKRAIDSVCIPAAGPLKLS